uniref:Uncharacterized protein n=1 Tax=Arundo donax TaxID=35708 RepID=A0A0A8YXE2_ARUDO
MHSNNEPECILLFFTEQQANRKFWKNEDLMTLNLGKRKQQRNEMKPISAPMFKRAVPKS